MKLRDARGQAVVEYAIVFPIQLMLTLAIIQVAHVFVAKHVVSYAAYCGARAELVGESAEDAAALALSAVAGPSGADGETKISVPGWGELPRSGAARLKTEVYVEDTTDDEGVAVVVCNVDHLYELTIPVGNYITYQIGEMFISMPDIDETYDQPHLLVKGTCTLVRPWEADDDTE